MKRWNFGYNVQFDQQRQDANYQICRSPVIRAKRKSRGSSLDREDMLELLGNVLDRIFVPRKPRCGGDFHNAYKWAENVILIEISQNRRIKIVIEDDGSGIPLDKINTITERGVRLDESVDGHGIGLGIVNDIIEYYQGSIIYDISEKLGGLKVTIELPS